MNIEIEKYTVKNLTPILSFYRECGYGGSAKPSDDLWVAMHKDQIIGAVRVCREQGFLILRGMYIAEEQRRKGIGTKLLKRIKLEIHEECYCLPYAKLERFYSQIGFHRTAYSLLPPFLKARLDGYMRKDLEIISMKRQASDSHHK
ncbi:MAG: GNAT family N-acetyltransferase [Proteobacteria bacterium]|nr:GNAT family N-acetyltransferase [Pseudomonadota bacterium]